MCLDVIGIDDLEQRIHDLRLNLLPQSHILTVDAMQDGLEVVALTRILAIEQLEEAVNKVLRNVLDDGVVTQVRSQNELEQ